MDLDGLILHVMHKSEGWRLKQWTALVKSAKARSLGSGIIAIVAEVIKRLADAGVFARTDAMDYLANSQEAWFPPTETSDVEPIESLVERLDATVLGLIEALDADSDDLPKLLDEALTGSLWSRQIVRLGADTKGHQLWVLEARARLIWNKSTPIQRRSQFAMGVGLESALAIHAIAAELLVRLDEADLAAIQGDGIALAKALTIMAERLLTIPPFIPDTEMPANWRDVLSAWISGIDVAHISLDNMRLIEEAFIYRLVWGVEAIRMKRRAEGGSSDYIEGSATACLEAGLPKSSMAMLVRSGLPSRVAAQVVIHETLPSFITISDMKKWLASIEIEALSEGIAWPTPETSAIWQRFRKDALAAPIQRWTEQEWNIELKLPEWVNRSHPARIVTSEDTGKISIMSPDYRKITGIVHVLDDTPPSLMRVDFSADGASALIKRIGRGTAEWRSV